MYARDTLMSQRESGGQRGPSPSLKSGDTESQKGEWVCQQLIARTETQVPLSARRPEPQGPSTPHPDPRKMMVSRSLKAAGLEAAPGHLFKERQWP